MRGKGRTDGADSGAGFVSLLAAALLACTIVHLRICCSICDEVRILLVLLTDRDRTHARTHPAGCLLHRLAYWLWLVVLCCVVVALSERQQHATTQQLARDKHASKQASNYNQSANPSGMQASNDNQSIDQQIKK